ncbi:uncharacterized protein LOC118734291 [Rhagoletis pomonella]|uniref:uncharacterized protein LOC118734291 n=1 Tax=Rhagoletis pomonella TaxID=28610 RepID=UPI001786BCF7|nr:uncharacterized protein LOC118734291 [Rhagoletis pomonella]
MISKSNNTQVPTTAISILQNTHTTFNMASNGGANNLTNNSKMGSRRIFTPHFKLQVLESYRKDNDCKGNQRATARKYNIHRRQIQKWLQCESNLRSSVASINHSGLKHQFHNVSQQQQVPIMIPTNNNSQFGYHHFESKPQQLPLDTARQSVATNSTTVPSIPVVVPPSANASAQGVYAAANLAAVVAAAAAAGAAGAMAIATTSTTNTSSPLCQTVVSGNAAGISSPILHSHHLPAHHHHHHHYDAPYTHASANISIPMPVLTHLSPQHHRHYQYHNLPPHTHALLQTQSRVSTVPSLMSSTCLPVNVLSACSSEVNIAPEEIAYKGNEGINSNELREHAAKMKIVNNVEDCCTRISLNKYLHNACIKNGNQKEYTLQNYNVTTQGLSNTPCLTVTPIDLSIGSRRENAENINCSLRQLPKTDDVAENKNESVVDLTFRKRKVILRNDQTSKLMRNSENDSINSFTRVKDLSESDDDHIEVEIDVKSPPPKPVKLFKPYLLDEKEEKQEENENEPITEKRSAKHAFVDRLDNKEGSIPTRFSLDSDRNTTFHPSNVAEHNFQIGSAYFQECKPLNLPSAFNMTAISALSPVIPCAEGSPVSGYESSSSTYSESSYKEEFYRMKEDRACSIDFQVHAVCDNLTCQENCVQKWLNHDANSNPPTTNASIVLYA